MSQYGALRQWAAALTFVGILGVTSALAGTIVWTIEVDGFWPTVGVLLLGGSFAMFLGAVTMAVAQALRALADVGDTVSAG